MPQKLPFPDPGDMFRPPLKGQSSILGGVCSGDIVFLGFSDSLTEGFVAVSCSILFKILAKQVKYQHRNTDSYNMSQRNLTNGGPKNIDCLQQKVPPAGMSPSSLHALFFFFCFFFIHFFCQILWLHSLLTCFV